MIATTIPMSTFRRRRRVFVVGRARDVWLLWPWSCGRVLCMRIEFRLSLHCVDSSVSISRFFAHNFTSICGHKNYVWSAQQRKTKTNKRYAYGHHDEDVNWERESVESPLRTYSTPKPPHIFASMINQNSIGHRGFELHENRLTDYQPKASATHTHRKFVGNFLIRFLFTKTKMRRRNHRHHHHNTLINITPWHDMKRHHHRPASLGRCIDETDTRERTNTAKALKNQIENMFCVLFALSFPFWSSGLVERDLLLLLLFTAMWAFKNLF